MEVRSTTGDRRIALGDLFTGPGRTTIRPDELIVAIVLPELDGAGSCYVRLEFRRQMEIAVVGATAVVSLEDGVVRDARIAITALAPTVRRVAVAEAALIGTDGGPAAAAEAGRLAADACDADLRRPFVARRTAGRWPRSSSAGRSPCAVARARGETIPIPASASTFGAR